MKISMFVSSLLVSSMAMAVNIRVIGNGGGETEMQLLTQVSEVKERLRLCVRQENLCNLNAEDKLAIRQLLALLEAREIVLNGDEPHFANTHLTGSEAAFLGLVDHPEIKASLPDREWDTLAHLLMSLLQNRSYPLAFVNQKLVTVKAPGGSMRILMDKHSELTEVTEAVRQSLKCRNSSEAQLIALTKMPLEKAQGYTTELRWSCGEMEKISDLQGRYSEAQGWRFQSSATRIAPPAESICESVLVSLHNSY